VLFLDELTEFRRNADEAFYQPRKTRAMLAALMSVPPTRQLEFVNADWL